MAAYPRCTWGKACVSQEHCIVPSIMRMTRNKMLELTGNADDILWIGETGWSCSMMRRGVAWYGTA